MQEIQLHAISVWTVADIITALRNDVDAYECCGLFAPGFVTERLPDLIWSRSHGEEKREPVVREILRREGYAAQCTLIGEVTPADAPVLSLDAAMLLVESASATPARRPAQRAKKCAPQWKTSCAHAKPSAFQTATHSSSAAASNASAFCAHGRSATVKMWNANR